MLHSIHFMCCVDSFTHILLYTFTSIFCQGFSSPADSWLAFENLYLINFYQDYNNLNSLRRQKWNPTWKYHPVCRQNTSSRIRPWREDLRTWTTCHLCAERREQFSFQSPPCRRIRRKIEKDDSVRFFRQIRRVGQANSSDKVLNWKKVI